MSRLTCRTRFGLGWRSVIFLIGVSYPIGSGLRNPFHMATRLMGVYRLLHLDEPFWDNARVVMPPPNKTSVHLRLDADVLAWFREPGRGHLSRMNTVLRSFMDAQRP